MTTIHTPAPDHTARLARVSALVLALVAMVALAVLAAASDDPPATPGPADVDGPESATGFSRNSSTLGDWDVLCFKPAYRDAAPCLRRSAPDQVTSGRLP